MRRVVVTAILGFLLSALGSAQPEPVRVLASNGVRPALKDLIPECERAIGRPLAIEFNPSAAIKRTIDADALFDVTILTSDVIDTLIKGGKLDSGTHPEVGRIGVGVGILQGAPKPNIQTPDAIKATLLNAKAITYGEEGASRPAIDNMIQVLGIADRLRAKTRFAKTVDESMVLLRTRQVDTVLTLISEILPVQGVEFVGPLPAKFQMYVKFSMGISASSKNKDAARALVQFLTGPSAAAAFKAKGIDRGK